MATVGINIRKHGKLVARKELKSYKGVIATAGLLVAYASGVAASMYVLSKVFEE